MSYRLGISAFTHDTSAALYKDEELIFFIEEERLNREKHTAVFPYAAMAACLDFAKIQISDVESITLSQLPFKEISGNLIHFLTYFPHSLNLLVPNPKNHQNEAFFSRTFGKINIKNGIAKYFKTSQVPKLRYLDHHLCHHASAFANSGFRESALLSLDGRGESVTTTIGHAWDGRVEVLLSNPIPHSLGHFYAAMTDYLGFKAFHDEWKVMGLSAYGDNSEFSKMEKLIQLNKNGQFKTDLSFFEYHRYGTKKWLSEKFYETFGPPREKDGELTKRHQNIAFAAQKLVEVIGVGLAHRAYELTQSKNICLSGGVALNCLMNSRILKETSFEKIYVPPFSADAGSAVGAAAIQKDGTVKSRNSDPVSAYLGPEFTESEIEQSLLKSGAVFTRLENSSQKCAQLLSKGHVVAWFQGRLEGGARALGNRSILANPSTREMRDRINKVIKKREYFRPFAPVVLSERSSSYFRLPKDAESQYMCLIAEVLPEIQDKIPAVVHNDGTARVQTLKRDQNEKLYDVLIEFENLTGVPVLLNTSFNENEPIVCHPREAIACFMRTELDALIIGDFLLEKSKQNKGPQS